MIEGATTIELQANGIDFTAYSMGQGPLALCLHGFPDNAGTFRYLLPELAAAGYRAVAPFMRGYAPTKPSPTGCYQTAALAHDAIALIQALGEDKADVIGHDWGAFAANGAATLAPQRVRKLVFAGVPVGPALAAAYIIDYEQLKRSWYIFYFQTALAEAAVPHNDLAFIRGLWRDWSPDWTPPQEVLDSVLETLRQPGVVEAALGYYRAVLNADNQDPALAADQARIGSEEISVPSLYLHGRTDGCMGADLTTGMEVLYTAGLRLEIVPGTGHFLHLEKPALVNKLILDFLQA